MVLAHLEHPTQKMVEEYYLVKRKEIAGQLEYNWLNNKGMDITNILRGKLQMLDEILKTKEVFEQYDKLKTDVEAEEERLLKEKGAGHGIR